jgi:hypothetical protein
MTAPLMVKRLFTVTSVSTLVLSNKLLADSFEQLDHGEDHAPGQSGEAQPDDERQTQDPRDDNQNGHSPASAQKSAKSPITASVTTVSSQRSLRVYGIPGRLTMRYNIPNQRLLQVPSWYYFSTIIVLFWYFQRALRSSLSARRSGASACEIDRLLLREATARLTLLVHVSLWFLR